MVPVHVRISAAGVFRGECREALRTLVWFKVRGVWTRFATDLLVFETGQPVIIGYISLVAWGWVTIDGPVARYKTPSALRSQLTGWMHGFHASSPRDSLSLRGWRCCRSIVGLGGRACARVVGGQGRAVADAAPAASFWTGAQATS
jgi:hypothetical protein